MASNYYFDSDERDCSVKPPRMTAEEIDELNNNDENWFKYMMHKEPIVYKDYTCTVVDESNYTVESYENVDSLSYDSEYYDSDENENEN